jgi:hypothetical protein
MVLNRKTCFIIAAMFSTFTSIAQVNRYMVFFKDKNGSPYSVAQPSQFLSERAITRRINQGIEINEQDLPINPNYVATVRQTGADLFFKSKWYNAALVQCDQSLIPSIQNLVFVDHIEFVAPQARLIESGRAKLNSRKKNDTNGIETLNQLSMLGIPQMHEAGHKGEGMIIALFDAGFSGVNVSTPFQHLMTENKINKEASYDFVFNTDNVFRYDEHGTEVLSVIAAEVPDAFNGGAPEANFQLYITEDAASEYRIEEYNWTFAAERADSAGVDIINSSLGYYDFDDPTMNYSKAQMDGRTAVVTKAAQWAADRGMLVVCSAGNEGNVPSWRIVSAPADAFDVLAVGGVDAQRNKSASSSIGPTADGRIKPDVAALGVSVKVINPNGSITTASGTSLSAPLMTALVAGVWQRYPDLSNKEIIQLIKATSSQANNPDNLLGYGIPNFAAIVNYQDRIVQQDMFEVYPNPVTDTVVVSPIDPDSISSCTIEVISSIGQLIAKNTVTFNWLERNFQADLSALPGGIYFIRVWFGDRRFVFKVVKI